MKILRHHARFLAAIGVGLLIWLISMTTSAELGLRALYAANGFFACYLVLMLSLVSKITAKELTRRAEVEDEGILVIVLFAIGAVVASLSATVILLNSAMAANLGFRLMALAAVPLGWAMVQILMSFHYAHLYYRPEPAHSAEGLIFPDTDAPEALDFLYFSFGIGMTAQVSDVQVTTTALRKVVTLHAVGSYFYNAVIFALAVNAALSLAQ